MNTGVKILINFLTILSSFAFVSFLPRQTEISAELRSLIFKDITIDITNDESKWILVRSVIVKISLFIFVHAMLTMSLRVILARSSPATKEDPSAIKLLNNIIQNTLEQSFIFVGFYTYFLFDGPSQRFSVTNLLNIPTWFILGRVLFSLGYIVGTLIHLPQLRSFGFALNAFVNVLLLEQIFLPTQIIAQNFLQ